MDEATKRIADLERTVQSQQERLKKFTLNRLAIYYSTKNFLSTIRDKHEEEEVRENETRHQLQ